MRKKIVAGNWKMNLLSAEAEVLGRKVKAASAEIKGVEVLLFPPSIYLQTLAEIAVPVGAQNFYPAENGAFTGEISITQLKDCGATHALIGHSERRAIFGEKADFLKQKVDSAVAHAITPVFCCGEPLEIREAGTELAYVKKQLEESLFHLSAENMQNCIVAYEPVWAIGTGKTATVAQAEEMHLSIRTWISEKYNDAVAQNCSIIYGGSCNVSNAEELFSSPNVDGGLIGGASLQADSFIKIAQSF
jgi:triosephosphate isomerase